MLKTKFENIQNSPRKCSKTAKKRAFFNFRQFLPVFCSFLCQFEFFSGQVFRTASVSSIHNFGYPYIQYSKKSIFWLPPLDFSILKVRVTHLPDILEKSFIYLNDHIGVLINVYQSQKVMTTFLFFGPPYSSVTCSANWLDTNCVH